MLVTYKYLRMCYEDVAVKEQVLSADARKAPNLISQKIAIKKGECHYKNSETGF